MSSLTSPILKAQIDVYRDEFIKHGDNPKGVRWANLETQELRFDRLFHQILPLDQSFSVHDVGCGTAALHSYLLKHGIDHAYSGTEIVPEMINLISQKFPDVQIHNRNFLEANDEHYDFIMLSGTLNYPGNVEEDQWKEFVFQILSKMYEMSRYGIAFNFLTSYSTMFYDTLFYLNPTEVFDYCHRTMSRFVMVDHAYPLFESTVTVLRPEFLQKKYHNQIFEKYFHGTT